MRSTRLRGNVLCAFIGPLDRLNFMGRVRQGSATSTSASQKGQAAARFFSLMLGLFGLRLLGSPTTNTQAQKGSSTTRSRRRGMCPFDVAIVVGSRGGIFCRCTLIVNGVLRCRTTATNKPRSSPLWSGRGHTRQEGTSAPPCSSWLLQLSHHL